MNILTEKLPTSVCVSGKIYKINPDFKTAIKIITYGEENSGIRLMIYALKTFYEDVPEDIAGAIIKMKEFYNGKDDKKQGRGIKIAPVFSFSKDADAIFSSFYGQYGINLAEDNLHWYVFVALLRGLCGDNMFSRVLEIRSLDLSDIKDDGQRKRLEKLKQKYSLSEAITLEEGLRGLF